MKWAGACMTDWGPSSESARVRTGSAVSSFDGYGTVRGRLSLAVGSRMYLGLAVLAQRAGDVVYQGRPDVAGLVLADMVHLGVVLDLRAVSAPRACFSSENIYLSRCGAIAIDWRGVDRGRIRAGRGDQMVRGARRPSGFH